MSEKKSRGSLLGFFLSMQIADLILDGLDLFLHHRHSLCKIVVFPHFSCQFFQLAVRYCLGRLKLLFNLFVALRIGDDNAKQREYPGNYCYNNFNHVNHPFIYIILCIR